jgi:quercetin dioxygenase-like cupin family protein
MVPPGRPLEPEDEMDAVDPLQPSPALRRRVLAAARAATRFEGFVERFARLFDLHERRAREILASAGDVHGQGWVDAPLAGVRLYHFPGGERVSTADCGLVHLAPGTAFPAHRHRGSEWVFVLAGSAQEEGGGLWLPGDLVIRDAGSVHAYRAVGDDPFLFAVVLRDGIEIVGA